MHKRKTPRGDGISRRLKNLIMDYYFKCQVRIWSGGSASEPIEFLKGVKQGYLLSPLLFNICDDPLISYLRDAEELKYEYRSQEHNHSSRCR
jgi:hypothetical protein